MIRALTTAAATVTLAVALICALPSLASAQQKNQPPARPGATAAAAFQVTLIEASKADKPFIDPRLVKMQGQLRPFTGKFQRFTLLSSQVLKLAQNQRGVVKIPSRGDFAITFLDFSAGKVRRARYQVELPKPRTKMTRRVAPGGQTLDVIPSGGKLTIVSTTVMR